MFGQNKKEEKEKKSNLTSDSAAIVKWIENDNTSFITEKNI